ncbi:MAG: DoxX family membrane protein [Pseudomonadota bacterium]|nr:DoxX family membrane protein [Pseudomonadota bacterium]
MFPDKYAAMEIVSKPFEKIDTAITGWMAKYSVTYLRVSLSLIFIWFGALKFFPNLSPTIGLIERTTEIVTFGNLPAPIAVYMLATIECLIGLGLLFKICMRATLLFLFLQMLATSTPIIFLPEVVFDQAPFALTMEGHHIIKNLVLICAGLVLGATVRGGHLVEAKIFTPSDNSRS